MPTPIDIIMRVLGVSDVQSGFNTTADAANKAGAALKQTGKNAKDSADDMKDAAESAKSLKDILESMQAFEIAKEGLEKFKEIGAEHNTLEDTHLQVQAIVSDMGQMGDMPGIKEQAEHLRDMGHFANEIQFERVAGQFELVGISGKRATDGMAAAASQALKTGGSVDEMGEKLKMIYNTGNLMPRMLNSLGVHFDRLELAQTKAAQAADPLNANMIAYDAVIAKINANPLKFSDFTSEGTKAANDLAAAWERFAEGPIGTRVAHDLETVAAATNKVLEGVENFSKSHPILATFGTDIAATGIAGITAAAGIYKLVSIFGPLWTAITRSGAAKRELAAATEADIAAEETKTGVAQAESAALTENAAAAEAASTATKGLGMSNMAMIGIYGAVAVAVAELAAAYENAKLDKQDKELINSAPDFTKTAAEGGDRGTGPLSHGQKANELQKLIDADQAEADADPFGTSAAYARNSAFKRARSRELAAAAHDPAGDAQKVAAQVQSAQDGKRQIKVKVEVPEITVPASAGERDYAAAGYDAG